MDVRVGPKRRLSTEEQMLCNCGVGKGSWESRGLSARRSNQSILNKISSEYSLEGLTLMLKLQYFGHQIRRTDSLEKTLMLGKIEVEWRREWQRMRWLHGITDSMNVSGASSGRWWRTQKPGVLQCMRSQSQTQLSDWNELNCIILCMWWTRTGKINQREETRDIFSSKRKSHEL